MPVVAAKFAPNRKTPDVVDLSALLVLVLKA